MTVDPVVTIAATPRGWASRLHAHATDHGGVVVRATVLTAADARDEIADVLLVDDITSFLSSHLVLQVRQAGRAVLGMYQPDDPQGRGDLVDIGVDALLPTDADVVELVGAIRQLAARQPADRARVPLPGGGVRGDRPRRGAGRLTGVVGCGGGVGTTEVAVALAATTAATGESTVLVDLDELGPALAQRLRLPVHPNLRSAVEALLGAQDVHARLQLASRRAPLEVLVGLPVAADHTLLPEEALVDTLRALAVGRDRLVLDLGRMPDGADGSTGRRYGHAEMVATTCHDLVLVTAPNPVAVARLVGLYARLGEAGPRVSVVLNGVRGNRFARDESVAELRRATGVAVIHLLPQDARVEAAGWDGHVVLRGRFARAVAGMAQALCGMGSGT